MQYPDFGGYFFTSTEDYNPMQPTRTLHRTLIAALISGASLMMLATSSASATTPAISSKHANALALQAAQRDFAQFVAHQQQRKGGAPTDFPLDIKDLQELGEARISYGFPVYTIDPPELLAGRSTMRSMAKPVNQWRFVIAVNGRAIGLATVEKNRGKFETVAYGGAVLAKDLDASAKAHGNADKSNLRFLRIYQARSDFLEVASDDGRGRFAPLHSARASLEMHKSAGKQAPGLFDESELMQPLRAAVQQNMAASR